jgi:hypothetical protein
VIAKKEEAYLFGPFIGELYWEVFRFAPYAIHLKKRNQNCKLIVFTRPSRFDLYGKYADIFVPLILKKENPYEQRCFNLIDFNPSYYGSLIRFFRKKYKNRFEIKGHFFPDIDGWRYKVKWQFPRGLMDYDFRPRTENEEIVSNYILDSSSYIISEFGDDVPGHGTVFITDFKDFCNERITNRSSFVGCLILLIRGSNFVIGNLGSFTSKLSLLLETPVVSVKENMSADSISLINPFDTPVISCRFIKEGVDIYENYKTNRRL